MHIFLVLLALLLPAQAQSDPCESPDVAQIAALFTRAQTVLDEGAVDDGLALLAVVEADLEQLLTRCTNKDVTGDEITPEPLTLTEPLTVPDTDIQIRYPAGWVVQTEAVTVVFANAARALDFTTITSGQIIGAVTSFPRDGVGGFGVSPGDSASAVLEAVLPVFIDSSEAATLSVAEAFDASGQPAAIVTGQVTQGNQTDDAALALVELGDTYVLIFVTGFETDTALAPLLRDIAGTVRYLPGQP